MTNGQIELKIKDLIKHERRITHDILTLINLADERRLYLGRGFPSLFAWLTQGLGYSTSAAHRRIESARLMRVVPAAGEQLKSGAQNLTNLARARSSIRAQEKTTGRKMTPRAQAKVVEAIAGQTTDEAELTLLKLLPESGQVTHREMSRRLDDQTERFTMNLTSEDLENLRWVKDHLSHALPNASLGQVIARLARAYRETHERAKRACEFQDARTGRRCASTHQLERDHIVPKALGGSDDASNLRWLCRAHNQFMAERWLGKRWANSWRKKRTEPSSRVDSG